jgi:hypothetical protein
MNTATYIVAKGSSVSCACIIDTRDEGIVAKFYARTGLETLHNDMAEKVCFFLNENEYEEAENGA